MTTYKQNVPEQVWVSPAIYHELLTALDPFTGYLPTTEQTGEPEVRNTDTRACGHFNLTSYGCESCFASLAEIQAEARELAGEDEMEYARR